ncbi:MAG: aspartate carbamoyltransferase, partial [Candidatus Paceibacterota bacterium]
KVGDDIKEYLDRHGASYEEIEKLDLVVGKVDVLSQTRIQKERFASEGEYKKMKGCYQIDSELVKKMKAKSIIMHPLPRVDEILTEVDSSPKAVYFKQAKYGLLVRMALLKFLLTYRS